MGLEVKITTELPGFMLDVSRSIQAEPVAFARALTGRPGPPEEVCKNPVNDEAGSLTDLKNLYSGYLFA